MKRFLALCLAVFLGFSCPAVAFAAESIRINVTEGDVLAGTVELLVSGGENLSFAVDGKNLKTEIAPLQLSFVTTGLDYAGGFLYSNTTDAVSLPNVSGSHLLALPSVQWEDEVIFTYVPAASDFTYGKDAIYGTYNIDDQEVSQIFAILPNGERITPDFVILYYPVEGSADIVEVRDEYNAEITYSIGDGWIAETGFGGNMPEIPLYVSFGFLGFDEIVQSSTGYTAKLDTTALEDGQHTLHLLSQGETVKEIGFSTDNTGPEISLNLAFGTALSTEDAINFSAADLSGNVKTYADIGGEHYFSGDQLLYIAPGRHTLVVNAEDAYGNSSTVCTEIYVYEKEAPVDPSLEKQVVSPILSGNASEYVYQIGNAKSFVFAYLGSTSEMGRIQVSVYDHTKQTYEAYGLAESGVKTTFEISEERFIRDGEVRISVQPYKYVAISDTVVWITDTQYYSNFEDLNSVYELILKYSVGLYREGNAGYLIHTGDIVDTYTPADKASEEWRFADRMHKILDEAEMPNGVLAGNHDTGNTPPDLTNFKRYFGKLRYSDHLWYGGSLDSNSCHYDLLTIGDTDYLFLYLSNGVEATERTVAWANAVCQAYSNRTVILCTHAYLATNGSYVYNPQDVNSYTHSRAFEIVEKIIRPNPNVAAVLCGHEHGAMRVQRDFGDGRYVWEILSDYQYAEVGREPMHEANGSTLDGEGYLRLITFGENGNMEQTTYSPLHDDYNFFDEQKDTFSVKLQTAKGEISLATQEAAVYFEKAAIATLAPTNSGNDGMNPLILVIAAGTFLLLGIGVAAYVITRKKKA